MKPVRLSLRTLALWGGLTAAALLGACGGGSDLNLAKPTFTAVVAFGDSLSDVGTYAPATSLTRNGQPPYFGGKFTTNSDQATVWVENIAKTLKLTVTPYELGFAGNSTICPAAAQGGGATCTGHAQGGARVTDPNGVGKSGGALTVPVKTQIENHLSRFTAFTANDLVFVYAGSNDVFTQFDAFSTAAVTAQTQAANNLITPAQAEAAIAQAQTQAGQAMATAAQELAGYVRTSILGQGARHVAVLLIPDIARTPLGASLPSSSAPVLTGLSTTFNQTLRSALDGASVLWIDSNQVFLDLVANPAAAGLSNVTAVACDATKIATLTAGQVTNGSSLFCNATPGAAYNGLVDGADPATWLWADGVHPSTAGHKALSDGVTKALQGAGWL